jgi:hypothetical protein
MLRLFRWKAFRRNADDSRALRLVIYMMILWLSNQKKLMKGDVK